MIGDFRVYVIANQVILWTVLTTVFALIIWKLEKPRTSVTAAAAGGSAPRTDRAPEQAHTGGRDRRDPGHRSFPRT